MKPLPNLLGVVLAVGGAFGVARGSSVPLRPTGQDAAVLRLAWTARPERIEDCRQQSDDELSKLPAHMRQSMSCVGTTATYRLEVRWNDQLMLQQNVRGGGIRHDRSLYLFRDISLPPGDAAISVRFTRVDSVPPLAHAASSTGERDDERHSTAIDDARLKREFEERIRGREEAIPPSLSFERRLHFAPRRLTLVTYDPERRALAMVEDVSR